MNEDEDGESYENELSELQEMKNFGNAYLSSLKVPFRRAAFEKSINAFRKSKCFEARPLEIAMEFAKLMTDYPNRTVYGAIPKGIYKDSENGNVEISHYLAFYWSGSENLNEQFFNYVDNDLQERGQIIEPLALQWFDTPQVAEQFNFNYEARLFPLLTELNNFLYGYDYANKHH
ncbi:hypothetical protein ACRQ5D_34420 [Mucilaginibacter sp. P25]|uniref:hypothetical protein n=1 Tax=Mucilaginibacter sp. P25 TaxID=3423945 RepID=UPI003D7B013D